MTEYLKAALEWVKLQPKYLFAFFFVSSFLLFAPKESINKLGLISTVEKHRWAISLIFLLSIALLITPMLISIGLYIQGKIKHFYKYHRLNKRLHDLTKEEKTILNIYIQNDTKTQNLDSENGVVAGLQENKIIYRATNSGDDLNSWPFNIQNWARRYLKKNKKLLDS